MDAVGNSVGCALYITFGVISLIALCATWGTGHLWAAIFRPPYTLYLTFAWLFGLPPFPI